MGVSRNLVFLKLGGSLITDKDQPYTARLPVIDRLAGEIAAALARDTEIRLLLGHGSGSFGHVAARQYGTRQGVRTPEQWKGFAEVWKEAAALDRLVMDALHQAGLPAMALPASASVVARDGKVASWDLTPVQLALQAGLMPVVYGDVIFDQVRGGTILSTEDLFVHLATQLKPHRLLLAGLEPGVWEDFPACTRLVSEITPQTIHALAVSLAGSQSTDVTGGMVSKVQQMVGLVEEVPGLVVSIFSGMQPGLVEKAILGQAAGTAIRQA